MRHPDVYIGQTDSTGRVATLERVEHRGFVYYKFKEVRLKIHYSVSNDEGVYMPHSRNPRGIREARRARREYIETLESMGKTVKGKQYINLGLMCKLNRDRFTAVPVPLEDMTAFKQMWDWEEFLMINADVYGPREYENLGIGTLKDALENEAIWHAHPRGDAKEI